MKKKARSRVAVSDFSVFMMKRRENSCHRQKATKFLSCIIKYSQNSLTSHPQQ